MGVAGMRNSSGNIESYVRSLCFVRDTVCAEYGINIRVSFIGLGVIPRSARDVKELAVKKRDIKQGVSEYRRLLKRMIELFKHWECDGYFYKVRDVFLGIERGDSHGNMMLEGDIEFVLNAFCDVLKVW